jgi:hypothetical protein
MGRRVRGYSWRDGALVIIQALIVRSATEMAVTNKRVIIKVGLFRKKTIELFRERYANHILPGVGEGA